MPNSRDVIGCYYGINTETFEVERVVRRRGGMLTINRSDVVDVRFLGDGPIGQMELRYLFGLSDATFVTVACMGTVFERKLKAKMRMLAEHYRREAA